MANIWIPPARIDLPAIAETHTARPTHAVTADAMAGSALHLACRRFLRCKTRICEYVPGESDDAPDMEVRVRWTTSAFARYVWVAFGYFAAKVSGFTPLVDVSLTSPDEVTTYDAGVRFTSAAQGLRVRAGGGDDLVTLGQTNRDLVHTGFQVRPNETGQTTQRRLLNINDSGGAHTDVVCKLDTVRTRILWVTVWEAPREVISQ